LKSRVIRAVQDKIGVDATGEVFNSITAVERMRGKRINPLVNPRRNFSSTSLIAGVEFFCKKWKHILQVHSDFADGKQKGVS